MKKIITLIFALMLILIADSVFVYAATSDLHYTTLLKKGTDGYYVEVLQNKLIELGFNVNPTGYYGSATTDSIKGVQSATGLYVDGKVGRETIYAINELSHRPAFSNTANFCQDEFRCRHCGKLPPNGIPLSLLLRLETLKVKCNFDGVYITSGYRCKTYNAILDGTATNSQHIKGTAADVIIDGYYPSYIYKLAEPIFGDGGLGLYDTFVHMDVRGYRARW